MGGLACSGIAIVSLALVAVSADQRSAAASCSSDVNCAIDERCDGLGSCATGVCVPAFTMPLFPLSVTPAVTAYTARLVSVMDHSGAFYQQCCDTKIVAFTGETAIRGSQVELCPAPPDFPACFFTSGCICGYKHPEGESYVVNGNYVGALFGPQYLSYDGHAGYDYGYPFTTPIVAPRNGNLCKAQEDPINGHLGQPSAWDKFHTFYIDHGVFAGQGYSTWYLHADDLQGQGQNGQNLPDLAPGECAPVAQGQTVATVGNVGTFVPHLHFEVRRYVPGDGPEATSAKGIDAYGWSGSEPDPLASPLHNPQAESQLDPLWIACGNGRVECGEQCDDGNTVAGDCCSSTCQLDPDGAACEDGKPCTGGDTCSGGVCSSGTFVCPLDHYKCYQGKDLKAPRFAKLKVADGLGPQLSDQLGSESVDVLKAKFVCTPVDKNGEGVSNPGAHLTCYQIKGTELSPQPVVELSTQFQPSRLALKKPKLLCLPATKTLLP